MCGRYASSRSPEDIVEEFEVLDPRLEQALPPSWNVAPTDEVYAVLERRPRNEAGEQEGDPVRQLRTLRWGLVPSWAKDEKIGSRMINARMETVAEKPAFRKAFASRRCIIPADGYFEWYELEDGKVRGGKPRKQPFFITPEDGSILAMAGLYEIWRNQAVPPDAPDAFRWTCTVLTTAATDELGRIHDRMPLLVDRDSRAAWLDPRHTIDDLSGLLTPAQQGGLTAYPVSTAVGNVANNGPQLVEPVPLASDGAAGDGTAGAGPDDDAQGTLL
ncbi:putative SOS response-associated peptidase YedK [Nocardioides sp. J9]|uniref:SOS response-associated peptidase n=1 Tax=unclassified Nocardioides TaxID=2615069 RepID=UPI0004B58146|nr:MULTISPECIES: SOS response-associated peptidase [unclassified Nocardioides]TWH01847.1 putative SOS response-associated peptidase YedK [Nocardioides sp. J9]